MPQTTYVEGAEGVRNALIAARKRSGLSQQALAGRLGWSQQAVSYVETGVRRLDIVEFWAWAHALGREPVDLYREITRGLPEKLDVGR